MGDRGLVIGERGLSNTCEMGTGGWDVEVFGGEVFMGEVFDRWVVCKYAFFRFNEAADDIEFE